MLDVGELVARLTLDDSRYVQGTQSAAQSAVQTSNRINTAFQGASRGINDLGTNAQQTARRMAEIELNRNLDRQAQNAATRLAELRANAQRAGQSAEQIALNESLVRDAVRATNEIEQLRRNAQQAAGGVDEIGNAASQASQQVNQLGNDLNDVSDSAGSAGDSAGGNFLSGFTDTIGNLASSTGPIAGSLLGVAVIGLTAGAALAAAIRQGMEQEKTQDLFQARTGTTTAQARKFGLAAGESYADAFGESVEGNLDTAKFALRNGLLDPTSTQRDAEKMINSLDGVATIMEEEIPAVAKAAGQALKTGFAADAQDAFDLFTKATQLGLNNSEDFLDTVNEYGTQFRKLGLTGAESIGLMSQAVKAGARDTDLAADALKEFSIRAIDGSELSAKAFADLAYEQDGVALSQQDLIANNAKMSEGFGVLGFNAEEMGKKIAGGGEGAREALGQVLDRLRGVTDAQERATIATALFGTQAEDLGDALYAMDLDTAIQAMNDYEGAAWRAINVMGGNASTSVEGALRSIEVASDGMKAALAQAFGPYIKEFADSISNNRAGVIQFFIDVGNAGFEMAKSIAGWAADALRSLGSIGEGAANMAAGALRAIAPLAGAMDFFNNPLGLPGVESNEDKFNDMADAAESAGGKVKETMGGIAKSIDDNVIPGLDKAQERFNQFAGEMKLSAAFNDESAKVSKAIADIGIGADGNSIKIENWTGAIDRNNAAQVQMQDGLAGMAEKLRAQVKTGMEAGNTVEALTGQYHENYDALISQLRATGMNNQAAVDYLKTLGMTPEFVDTVIKQSGMPEAKYELDVLKGKIEATPDSKIVTTEALTQESMEHLEALGIKTRTLPNGKVEVFAETKEATRALEDWLMRNGHREVVVQMQLQRIADVNSTAPAWSAQRAQDYFGVTQADGGVRRRADGMIDTAHIQQGSGQGIYTKSPLGPVQYAEGETQWEAYIPGALSKRGRSVAILQDVARRFGFGLIRPDSIRMADGGVVESFTGIASQHAPGLTLTSSYRDTNDYHGQGKAVDYSNGSGNTDEQLAWANYLADNYQSQLAELIYSDPRFTRNIKDGKIVDPSFYGAATMQQHENHVHAASKEPLGAPSGAGKDAAPAAPDTRTEREKIADQVIAEGKRRGISDKGIKAAVMAALAETDLQNLDYGMDGDNAGILQQRSQGWGTLEDRKDPTRAAGMFYDKLDDFDYNSMTEAEAAQKVQQSGTADGSNYAVKAAEADEIIAASNARNNGQMTTATTTSGAALATDGQRVFVTNWPGSSSSYSATEATPSTVPAGGTSDAAGKDPNLIWSGGFKVFENGGMNLPDQAGLYSDGADLVRFAEKGTGGEGYIPLALSKRSRSVAITKTIANRFGYELVPMADGGLTGFGGYVGEKPGLKVPTTANGRRAAAYNAAAFGVGAAFALASGFDADGKFTGQFDTSANSSAQLEKGFGQITDELVPLLEGILLAIKNREPIRAQVNVDRDSGMANIAITKGGI